MFVTFQDQISITQFELKRVYLFIRFKYALQKVVAIVARVIIVLDNGVRRENMLVQNVLGV